MVVGKFGVRFLNHLYDFVLFGGIGVCYRVYRSQGICVDYRWLDVQNTRTVLTSRAGMTPKMSILSQFLSISKYNSGKINNKFVAA